MRSTLLTALFLLASLPFTLGASTCHQNCHCCTAKNSQGQNVAGFWHPRAGKCGCAAANPKTLHDDSGVCTGFCITPKPPQPQPDRK
ncbi:unnamed protein product [Zymoseptoria tritici ST99CH_1E4]|uniref:Uncharacterized protein n=1 Tax=Zymoseptoria tritici ST99CH_1E4 TaxID=1276532 RepID=A0A2H1GXU1_ZYMTR|nr:unnamed protein product [Zymoseptoria tritici ST99CH_1E4]